jgi:hypothetical protein
VVKSLLEVPQQQKPSLIREHLPQMELLRHLKPEFSTNREAA